MVILLILLTTLVFVIILGLLVIIHEFGHFIIAKKAGVLVEEFAFGFPPKIFGIKKGETTYSLNAVPLGGYVKVYGEEYYEEDENKVDKSLKNRAFIYKKPWQKALIVVGGVVMNLILAVTIYYGLLGFNNFRSQPLIMIRPHDFTFGRIEENVMVTRVVENSPAEKAGLKQEDIVLRFKVSENVNTNEWIRISSANQLIKTVNEARDKKVFIETRNNKTDKVEIHTLIPKYDKEVKRAIIGIQLNNLFFLHYDQSFVEKIFSGFMHAYNMIEYQFAIFGHLFSSAFKDKTAAPVTDAVSGPVGIMFVVYEVIRSSGQKIIVNLLDMIALLSLSLAVMNILPFPALDGGRLVFIIYEWITGKRPHQAVEKYTNLIGIITLLSMALLVTINDIIKFVNYFLK